jgi:predicted XRE-type DNA-binding protein
MTLKQLVAQSGLKHQHIAAWLNIAQNSWSDRVHGRIEMRASEITVLARLLNVSTDTIVQAAEETRKGKRGGRGDA